MQIGREELIKRLNAQIKVNGHIIGVAAGSGMTTRCCVLGGADLILALSAGHFRQTGRASIASYLCYSNSNQIVMDFASHELMPLMPNIPILFGMNATDPTICIESYVTRIIQSGFDGINNWPTIGLIDGQFREALEEEGISYQKEVEMIREAHRQGCFTLAFVFDEMQAEQMLLAGADVICAHLGVTIGGILGAKKVRSLDRSRILAQKIYEVCDRIRPDVIKMIYGGPVKSPLDSRYFYDNTECRGFIGGSSFERIPVEKAIINTTKAFKYAGNTQNEDALIKVLAGEARDYDYVEFIKNHIRENYGSPIYLSELALAAHISAPYLSSKFKKSVGCSFTEYLIRFRINKACEFLQQKGITITKTAELVGYSDYIQFAKIFKKYKGMTPKAYRASVLSH